VSKLRKDGQKNKSGKPPKFKSEKELNDTIIAYFKDCEEKKTIANKAGLCLFLKISRDTYSEYRKKYPDTIKGADFAIENVWVQRLAGSSPTGAIFYLKNAFKEEYKDGQLEGVGAFGIGTLKSFLAQAGLSSEEAMSVRSLIGSVKGTIAKLRGGTSFTANEEKLLNSYVPTINDNPAVIMNKIALLKDFINSKEQNLRAFSVERILPNQKTNQEDLRKKYNY